jgi:hypothetical protein
MILSKKEKQLYIYKWKVEAFRVISLQFPSVKTDV